MPEGSRSYLSAGLSSERSSSEPALASWLRLALPSVADLLFVVLLCVLVFTPLAVRLLGDAGIGWHIRTGQQILATHTIPRVDSFSSTMAGKPWFAWEWLYDVLVGKLEAAMGLNGVVWFTASVIATVFAGMFRFLSKRGASLCLALPLVVLAISASMIHFLARPHVLSWLFTLVGFWILDSYERARLYQNSSRVKPVGLFPLLMLLWVNLHGGFLLGFVLLGIFWLAAIWEWLAAKENRLKDSLRKIAAAQRARTLTWVGLLSVAASLVNPYGWKLHAHVYSYLSNRFLMDHIDEFQSPNFHGVAQKCFLALLLISLAGTAVRGRNLRLSAGLTVLFAVYAGLYASRNIPTSSVLLVMVLGPLLSAPVGAKNFLISFFARMTAIESRTRAHLWPVILLVATFLIAVNGGHVGSAPLMNAHFDPKRMPVEAVNHLQNELTGPLLAPDYWGGYLIYRLYPGTQVVLDDRHDLYGPEFFKSYLKLIHVEPGWENFLREHPSSCILLPTQSPLADRLKDSPERKTIFSDDVAVAYVRTTGNRNTK
jgi:hypothetical protein